MFYIAGISGAFFLFQIAMQWSEVVDAFARVESIFQNEVYAHSSGWSLKRKMRITSAILLLFALLEHSMACASFLYDRFIQIELCKFSIGSMFFYLATTHLGHIYHELPVKVPTVVWAEYMNVSLTFVWNFIDLFIILISMAVASKFEKINKRLEFFRERVSHEKLSLSCAIPDISPATFQIVTDNFWEEIRCHYNEVCELHEFLDEKVGFIVCVACLNDLFFVCMQLLNVAT